MFTIVGYSASITADATYKNIAAIADNHLKVVSPYVYISALNQLAGVYVAGGSTPDGAYLASPSLRRLAYYDIPDIDAAIEPEPVIAANLFPKNPIPLATNEGLEIFLKGTAAGAEISSAVVYLADGAIAPVSGEISTFEALIDLSGHNTVASTWSSAPMAFRQTLPVGRYQVVGAKMIVDNAVAFRFIPVGEAHRPGGIVNGAIGELALKEQRYGEMGVWFEFDSVTPPSVEVLSHTAIAADCDIFLDMIKVA